jgi:hypothetical protein
MVNKPSPAKASMLPVASGVKNGGRRLAAVTFTSIKDRSLLKRKCNRISKSFQFHNCELPAR